MRINWLVIHATATPPSMDIGADEINQWHLERGWRGIGYHYVIRRNGIIEKGRKDDVQGAHVLGHNEDSLGITLVGGVKQSDKKTPEDNFTKKQMDSLEGLMKDLKRRYPSATIIGHNGFPEHKSRGCPCFDWHSWRDSFYMPDDWYDEVKTIREEI